MVRGYFGLAMLALASMALAACGQTEQEKCLQAGNPAQCTAWIDAGGDLNDYLVGGMAGYMLAKATSPGGGYQSMIVPDPRYSGPTRHLRRPIMSRDHQVRQLQRKVERQRIELQRKEAALVRAKHVAKPGTAKRYASSGHRSSYRSSRRR